MRPDLRRLPGIVPPFPHAAAVHADHAGFLKLLAKWDAAGALALLPASAVEPTFRCGAFAVFKNVRTDRFITNPTRMNSVSSGISRWSRLLAPGPLLAHIQLPPGHVLVASADDLQDFYHTFLVGPRRAARNAFNMTFPGALFEGWSSFSPDLARSRVIPALRTLAMGDNLAVELAQCAHWCLLRRAGCAGARGLLKYHSPVPRGPLFELLAIDDHVAFEIVARPATGAPAPFGPRLDHVFSASAAAYSAAGLSVHPGKRVRQTSRILALGAEVRGEEGDVAAPRLRVGALMTLTLRVARLRRCTPRLMRSIAGSWCHALLFRRPML